MSIEWIFLFYAFRNDSSEASSIKTPPQKLMSSYSLVFVSLNSFLFAL
jgi:hypothetical protein